MGTQLSLSSLRGKSNYMLVPETPIDVLVQYYCTHAIWSYRGVFRPFDSIGDLYTQPYLVITSADGTGGPRAQAVDLSKALLKTPRTHEEAKAAFLEQVQQQYVRDFDSACPALDDIAQVVAGMSWTALRSRF